MAADDITTDRAEALALLRRVLALMDARGFGVFAAPHVDLALHLLSSEQANHEEIDVR